MNHLLRFNPWVTVPFIGIGLTVIFNIWMINTANRIRPSKVEAHPYQASAMFDDEKLRKEAFAAAKMGLRFTATQTSVEVQLVTESKNTPPVNGRLRWWRPDDPAQDFTIDWSNPSQPLTITSLRSGRWRVQTSLTTSPSELGYLNETLVEVPQKSIK